MMNLRRLVALLVALALLSAGQIFADDSKPRDQKGHDERVKREQATKERVDRENKVQREQDKIRKDARAGGYEDKYDKAVKENAGPRTKESVERSRPKTGTGHAW